MLFSSSSSLLLPFILHYNNNYYYDYDVCSFFACPDDNASLHLAMAVSANNLQMQKVFCAVQLRRAAAATKKRIQERIAECIAPPTSSAKKCIFICNKHAIKCIISKQHRHNHIYIVVHIVHYSWDVFHKKYVCVYTAFISMNWLLTQNEWKKRVAWKKRHICLKMHRQKCCHFFSLIMCMKCKEAISGLRKRLCSGKEAIYKYNGHSD